MPIYEFECGSCGIRFDRLQKLSDPDPAACPECGQTHVRRCVTAPSFRLAGSGWYETDFKKDGDKKRHLASKDEAPKPAADKSDSGKTQPATAPSGAVESKPATQAVASETKSAAASKKSNAAVDRA